MQKQSSLGRLGERVCAMEVVPDTRPLFFSNPPSVIDRKSVV